jgi:2-oxoisovalerate dehydrogenase E1 component beta subunit
LILKYGNNISIKTCSLSTLIVENYFSSIRDKIRNTSMLDYAIAHRSSCLFPNSKLSKNSSFKIASIRDKNPVLFFEPKILYRSSESQVPIRDYTLPLGVAEVIKEGKDITVIGWGSQMYVLEKACAMAAEVGIDCELIDLRSILPWDVDTVVKSVQKTGRCLVSHEAPLTGGFGAEVAATIQEKCFLYLESPVIRVCGLDTPFPLVHEKYYVPDAVKNFEMIKQSVNY